MHGLVCVRIASDSGPPGSNYFILLILTDGIITDMPQTREAIVNVRVAVVVHLTHSYLLNKEQPPNCNYCKSLLTVKHILTSCSAYNNIREKHYSNSQLSHILYNIFKQHIFNYLSEINFFNRL